MVLRNSRHAPRYTRSSRYVLYVYHTCGLCGVFSDNKSLYKYSSVYACVFFMWVVSHTAKHETKYHPQGHVSSVNTLASHRCDPGTIPDISTCEMVMWSQSQTGGFPPGTQVSSHTKTIRTQTSLPTSMINISCITCFVIVVK